jgi:hypothetical protein
MVNVIMGKLMQKIPQSCLCEQSEAISPKADKKLENGRWKFVGTAGNLPGFSRQKRRLEII